MKKLLTFGLICLFIYACNGGKENTSDNFYYYITRLGNDTLAIERIQKTENSLDADVVLRSPGISLKRYHIEWGDDQKLRSMNTIDFPDGFPQRGNGDGSITQTIATTGDSLIIESEGRNGMVRSALLNDDTYLPFIDMVHWPYDIAFNRAHLSKTDSVHQYLLTGRRPSDFIIFRTSDQEYTLRHPSRGVMYVQTDEQGNMTWLDAKETTRKLIVERVEELDFDRLTRRFLEIDKEGSPFGTLSPAEEAAANFGGAHFKLSYGSPQKRGRTIFGGIVPYGEVWRTGANMASHFSTSKDIYISGQKVPAGEYTLFSIPEEEGGLLIINQQTGQNGQAYDPSRDLLRVPMKRESNSTEVEGFTIQVVETNQGGSIELLWDRTIYYVDFTFN